METVIEFTHRVTSGLALVLVAVLVIWSFRVFPRGHRVRLAAALSAVLLLVEALLGAGLVLFRYVAQDASIGRAVYLSAHLINTQLLLAALALTARLARRPEWPAPPKQRPRALLAALPVALALSVTGAIAALGDTLFPARTLTAGVRDELSGAAHVLLRLRLIHPVVAIAFGGYLLWAAASALREAPPGPARRAGGVFAGLVLLQWAAGGVNVALLAPVWMQLVHLLLANLMWIALVLFFRG